MILEHSNTRWKSWIWKSDPLKVTIFPKSPNNNHVREWNKKLPSPKEHSTEGCAAGMSRYHIYKTSLHSTGDCNYEGPILLASFQKRSNNILKYVFHKYIFITKLNRNTWWIKEVYIKFFRTSITNNRLWRCWIVC